ncbi:MAG: hypothetical protein ABL986_22905 [Vicinamibacterales bacterium]
MALGESVVYVLDENDRLAQVGATWDRAALENGAPKLCAASALGTSLWLYIGDATTVELYQLILARVRTGRLASVPFDGSGAGIQREMRLHLRSLPAGHVECTSTIVREHGHAPVQTPDVNTMVPLTVCSWCGRMRVEGEWRDVDVAVGALRVFLRATPSVISHGACHACAARLTDDVRHGR